VDALACRSCFVGVDPAEYDASAGGVILGHLRQKTSRRFPNRRSPYCVVVLVRIGGGGLGFGEDFEGPRRQ
jgi:hypothetical protein